MGDGSIRHVRLPEERDLPGGEGVPFSRATVAGGFVFVSGISGGVRGSATKETWAALASPRRVLEAAGSSLERVVQMTLLITDPANDEESNAEYARHFQQGLPARHTARFGVPTTARCSFARIALAGKEGT